MKIEWAHGRLRRRACGETQTETVDRMWSQPAHLYILWSLTYGPQMSGKRLASLAVVTATLISFSAAGRAQSIPEKPRQGGPYEANAVIRYPYQPPWPLPYGYGWWPLAILRSNSQRARLQVMGPLKWDDICVAPCSAPVNPQGLYRIGGGVIYPSKVFTLPRSSGQIFIDASATSVIRHWTGFGLMVAGAVVAAAGGAFYATAPDAAPDDYMAQSNRDDQHSVGLSMGVVGIILMAVGTPIFARTTRVQVQ